MSTEDRARSYAEAFYEAALERWIAALDAAYGSNTPFEPEMKA